MRTSGSRLRVKRSRRRMVGSFHHPHQLPPHANPGDVTRNGGSNAEDGDTSGGGSSGQLTAGTDGEAIVVCTFLDREATFSSCERFIGIIGPRELSSTAVSTVGMCLAENSDGNGIGIMPQGRGRSPALFLVDAPSPSVCVRTKSLPLPAFSSRKSKGLPSSVEHSIPQHNFWQCSLALHSPSIPLGSPLSSSEMLTRAPHVPPTTYYTYYMIFVFPSSKSCMLYIAE
jgi:hypothetical protein